MPRGSKNVQPGIKNMQAGICLNGPFKLQWERCQLWETIGNMKFHEQVLSCIRISMSSDGAASETGERRLLFHP